LALSLGCIYAAVQMHSVLMTNVMRWPMEVFDQTPIGRILNRFSKDVDVIDTTLPLNIRSFMMQFFAVNSRQPPQNFLIKCGLWGNGRKSPCHLPIDCDWIGSFSPSPSAWGDLPSPPLMVPLIALQTVEKAFRHSLLDWRLFFQIHFLFFSFHSPSDVGFI
jgi:ABC-type multidrug transport system fused ATPase/permease subunit